MPWIKRALRNNEWRMEIGKYTLILESQIDTNLKGKKILKFECGVFIGGDDYNEDRFYHKTIELHTPKTKNNYGKYVKKITNQCITWIEKDAYREEIKFRRALGAAMMCNCSKLELVIK